jgi:hypothetical protein
MKFRSILFASTLLLAPTGAALAAGGEDGDAPAAKASQLNLAMTIYAGGITIGKVDMDASISDGKYRVVSNLQTDGVVNAFWQAKIQATSNGKIGTKEFQPTLYDSFDTNHTGKRQEVSLTYDNGAPVRLYADPAFSTSGYEVKPDQQKATFDPLSAVVYIASGVGADASNPCGVVAPIFDGRRRYNIELTKVKDTTIKMDNGLYNGPGLVCSIRYHQLAGFKPKILKENEKFPAINAWFATMPSAIAGRTYVVPLRVWADTPYGVVSVVATALKVDGAQPRTGG